MSWLMWVLVGILFSIGFAVMLGIAIHEVHREAPVDTYRRLHVLDGGMQSLDIERLCCPTCAQEQCKQEMDLIKSPDRPGYTGWECPTHGIMTWIDVR